MIDKPARIVITADGSTWVTVFDSATQGEYAETLAGKTHTFTQQNVRYVRDYLNGSTVNPQNHWTEIEVWGTTTTAYVGDTYEWNGSAKTATRYYYAGTTRVAVRNGNGSGTNGLVYLLSDHLGSTSLTADPLDGDKLSELRFKAWGETRYALTSLPTDRRFTGQIEEAGLGLYFFNARWYDSALGRWAQPDSIVPVESQGVQAWDRYAFVNNNPLRYNDPTGHTQACADGDLGGGCGSGNDNSDLSYSFDTKAIAEEYIPFTPEQLRNWAMKFDHFALGVDALAESIVLGHVGVGTVAGTAFEGNPVSGIPSGAGAGWILGETNPVVQSLVTLGNVSATIASTSSILADVKTGDSRLQLQVSHSTNNLTLNGSASVSSNSIASGYLTTLGWATRIVEGSLLVQGAAVAFDHGVVPTYIFTLPFNGQISNR